ncbi:hypothetical protein DYI37_06135 [Fulvimarina endophytica]|uniref:Uncharacterized protein n=1 Tax=Fulvimarina endophytica TaxID=2293836 RepID=A0A371X868_9HYPH|nr:hypothetical protein [Fulvimarina endophytica]RFC65398.1 hypothetical protein DYI37_06135 [Fulvimarina endophytica]
MSQTTRFDHPEHGSYDSPAAVAADEKLSTEDKKTLLQEWKQSLEHVLVNDPHASDAKTTRDEIDRAEMTL